MQPMFPQRRSTFLIVVFVLVVAVVVSYAARPQLGSAPAHILAPSVLGRYVADGPAGAEGQVTYRISQPWSGQTDRYTETVTLPWQQAIIYRSGDPLMVTLTNVRAAGLLRCAIYRDTSGAAPLVEQQAATRVACAFTVP
jgi:hypothetical protein